MTTKDCEKCECRKICYDISAELGSDADISCEDVERIAKDGEEDVTPGEKTGEPQRNTNETKNGNKARKIFNVRSFLPRMQSTHFRQMGKMPQLRSKISMGKGR